VIFLLCWIIIRVTRQIVARAEVVMKLPTEFCHAVVIALAIFSGTSVFPGQQAAGQEAKTLAIGPQAEIHFADPWTLSAMRYRNAQELVVVRRAELAAQPTEYVIARVLITTEPRSSYEDALKRLATFAAERDAQIIEVGGWPAVEVKFVEPLPRRGPKETEDARPVPDVFVQRVLTAIAADDNVVTFDGSILPDAPQNLLQSAQELARSARFATRGNPVEVEETLRRMRTEQRERQPSRPPRRGETRGTRTTTAARANFPAMPQVEAPAPVQSGRGELQIAASPDANNVVIAANSGLSFSTDRGAHFATGSSGVFSLNDPSVTRAQSTNFYLGGIAFPSGAPSQLNVTGCTNAVSRSTDNGANFALQGYSAICPLTGAGLCFPDQPQIAADAVNAAGGNDQLYAAWRNFTPTASVANCGGIGGGVLTLMISCSQDNGANWMAPQVIPGDVPRIAVGRDGSVYVVSISGHPPLVQLNRFTSCANGLLPASGTVTAATLTDPVFTCPVPGLDRCHAGLANPTVAPDPDDANHLFVSFAESDGAGGELIVAVESMDGGITFSGPRGVSGGVSARRFLPWSCSTHGRAWLGWYDRRAATAGANDLTDYFVGSTSGTTFNLSNNPDPQCASGWPCAPSSPDDSQYCSNQPQLAGFCRNAAGGGSFMRCDFDETICPSGETCQSGRGCPKYGDYNGIACANNFVIAAWSSATPPSGVTAPSPGINIYADVVALPTELTVRKILVHPDHNHLRLFNLQVDGITVRANVNGGSTGPLPMSLGNHIVGETGGTGTPLGAFSRIIGGDCAANGAVNLAKGDSKTCTITNYDHWGGCPTGSHCCEPGTDTQACQQCVGHTQSCP
jgi:hypothetical protein